jgi:lipopolysaccharide exporter
MTLKSKAVSGVKWTSLASAVVGVNDVARMVVLARLLSPDDFGLMAMALIVLGFAQMYADLGISAAIVHHQDITGDELSSLYWLNIFMGLAIVAIALASAPFVSFFFHDGRVVPLLRVAALVFLITPITAQFEILLEKELAFRFLAERDISGALANTAVAVTCAFAGFGVWSLVFGQLANSATRAVLIGRIGFARFRPSLRFRFADCRKFIGFGMFQIGERSINYLSQRMDQLLIGSLLGPRALGYYSFAFNLTAQPITRLNPIMTKVAFPVFAKLQKDDLKLRSGYLKLVGFIAAVNAPLLIGFAALAPWAVPVIFGPKWLPCVILIQILSLVVVFKSTASPIGSLQLAKGRADLGFWWNLLVIAFNVPAVYLGAKLAQGTGVATALLIVQVLFAIPVYLLLVRPLIGRCGHDYASVIVKPLAGALTMAMVVLSVPYALPRINSYLQLGLQLTVGAGVYYGILHAFYRKPLDDFQGVLWSK